MLAVAVVAMLTPEAASAASGGSSGGASKWSAYGLGVDVSVYQHPNGQAIDWWAARQSGVRFAYIKATEGPSGGRGTYTNSWFARDFVGAGNAGVPRGAYHYARPRYPLWSATQDADQFVSTLRANGAGWSELPPALDVEENDFGLSSTAMISWIHNWLDEVQRLTGRVPLIYTSVWAWTSYLGSTSQFTNYPLWVARYNVGAPGPLPGSWTQWTMWQYSFTGRVGGIAAPVDLSVTCPGSGPNGTGGECSAPSQASWVAAQYAAPKSSANGGPAKPTTTGTTTTTTTWRPASSAASSKPTSKTTSGTASGSRASGTTTRTTWSATSSKSGASGGSGSRTPTTTWSRR